ncbi:MAG: DNA primase [Methylocystaceae bacterium]|nr:MAG: DNA primase [Methylocystaceae bacterium]
MTEASDKFIEEIRVRLGAAPDEIGAGAIHRFSTSKTGRDDAGWYVFHDGDFPAGSFGDWRLGVKYKWCARETSELSNDDRARIAELKEERRKKIEAEAVKAAASARSRWTNAKPCGEDHPYLRKKGVQANGAREAHGCVVIPVYIGDDLVSIQTIDADGDKLFAKGTRVEGGYFTIGDATQARVIVIGEGFATCATIHENSGLPAVVAFNAGNLLPVAKRVREKHPNATIIIAADDDAKTEKARGFNPGIRAAKEAAGAVKGLVLAPSFDRAADGEGPSDWNDYASLHGFDHVASEFRRVCDQAEIKRLSALDAITYDRERDKAAETLGVRVSTLDKQVGALRAEESEKKAVDLCVDIEPCAEPVNVAQLLDDIRSTIQRFIVCEPETATAATLWIAFTWIIDSVQVAPLAVITAPEKRCGKTQLLDLIGRLSRRNLFASNISPAATFRVIEARSPTLLIDEADAFFRENEELRGVINSGHTRTSAYVIRTVGDDFEVKQFSTWGAKAIAGIGKLSDTIMDRAVVLPLRRKGPGEKVERLRHAEPGLFDMLARKLARFGEDHGAAIGRAKPALPDALNDRAQDNWEPLLAVADLAGGRWPSEARRAALAISGDGKDDRSAGEEVLADIRDIFDAASVERIALAELHKRLIEDETAPWATWNRGRPMTPRQLGARLKEFGLGAKPLRIDHAVQKGFERKQFRDAWGRYLDSAAVSSSETPASPVTRLQPSENKALDITFGVTDQIASGYAPSSVTPPPTGEECNRNRPEKSAAPPVMPKVTPISLNLNDCNPVTGETPLPGKEGVEARPWEIEI